MPRKPLNITVREYVTFRKEGLNVQEIADRCELTKAQLTSWVYNHRKEIDKALESVTIPASKEEKVLRSKDIPKPEQPKPPFASAAVRSASLDKNTETFSKIKDKLAQQKKDYEMLESNHEKLLSAHSKLKEEFTERGIKLRAAENKAAELDAQYKENYETAKKEWDTHYNEMHTRLSENNAGLQEKIDELISDIELYASQQPEINKLREEVRIKDSTIQELTIEAEKQAQADDEIESLKDQLEAAGRTLQRAFEESERYRTMYEKEVVPLRQLALIKLEADCSAQPQ